jgi:hypothetical protein
MSDHSPDQSDPSRCISVHWSLPVQCVLPRAHRENWHEAWHPETGNRLRYRYSARATEELHHGGWHALNIPGPARLLEQFTVQQCAAGEHADWAVDSEDAHVCPWCELERLRAESERERGESMFWHFEYRAAMDNYRGENWQVGQLRAELATTRTGLEAAAAKVRAVELLQCWTNEDGKRFLFADDVAEAFGITPRTTPVPSLCCGEDGTTADYCGVLNPRQVATCAEPPTHGPDHRDAFGNTWPRRDGDKPLFAKEA